MSNLTDFTGSGVKTGTVFYHAGEIPSDSYECDGSEKSRIEDAKLFAAIGTTYGSGDGSTTFNIPNCQGEFLRGLDNGRGVDDGRVLGSFQPATGVGQFVYQASNVRFINTDGSTTTSAISRAGEAGYTNTQKFFYVRPRNLAMYCCIKR